MHIKTKNLTRQGVVKLRINTESLGSVKDVAGYLRAVEDVYRDLLNIDSKIYTAYNSPEITDQRSYILNSITYKTIFYEQRAYATLAAEPIRLDEVSVSSPGFWDFVGSLNPLEVLRTYLNDLHSRRKDESYRNALEEEKMRIENENRRLANEKLKNEVLRERIELMREIGLTNEEIQKILSYEVEHSLDRLADYQKNGIIQDSEIVPIDEGG